MSHGPFERERGEGEGGRKDDLKCSDGPPHIAGTYGSSFCQNGLLYASHSRDLTVEALDFEGVVKQQK